MTPTASRAFSNYDRLWGIKLKLSLTDKRRMFCIHPALNKDIAARLELLESACIARDVQFVPLCSSECDFLTLPQPNCGDLIYNVGRGSRELECLLLSNRVASLYTDYRYSHFATTTTDWSLLHQREGLPVPKTIPNPGPNREQLGKYVEFLGGVPVIVKVAGGTRGMGVIRCDSMQQLYCVIDFLNWEHRRYLLRQYIPSDRVGRLIVLGSKVISAINYVAPTDDFRTSVLEDPLSELASFSTEAQEIAVRAVAIIGAEFGGVDIILDSAGKPYLLEVNFPTSFQRPQRMTGIDIAGMVVDHLVEKAKRLQLS